MTHLTCHHESPYLTHHHRPHVQQAPNDMVYENLSWKADCIATSNRIGAVLLVRLRWEHTPLLKAYAHLLGPATDPTWPLCKEKPQTLGTEMSQSESSGPTQRRCWRSLGPPSRALGTRLNNNNYLDTSITGLQSRFFIFSYYGYNGTPNAIIVGVTHNWTYILARKPVSSHVLINVKRHNISSNDLKATMIFCNTFYIL